MKQQFNRRSFIHRAGVATGLVVFGSNFPLKSDRAAGATPAQIRATTYASLVTALALAPEAAVPPVSADDARASFESWYPGQTPEGLRVPMYVLDYLVRDAQPADFNAMSTEERLTYLRSLADNSDSTRTGRAGGETKGQRRRSVLVAALATARDPLLPSTGDTGRRPPAYLLPNDGAAQ